MRNTIDNNSFPLSLLFEDKDDLFKIEESNEKKARTFQ